MPHRPRRREPAFFNLTVGDRSSINYVVPMVVGPSGYESALEVHLDTIAITSSLNDIRLVTAESTRVGLYLLPDESRSHFSDPWCIASSRSMECGAYLVCCPSSAATYTIYLEGPCQHDD